MSRSARTQWDFGELFPAETTRRVLSVSELTAQVRRLLEKNFGQVWVTGEVSNLRVQSSGHIYFTLKDAGAQLHCVLFRGETGVQRDLLEDGRKVVVQGGFTVYEPRGQYQLVVRDVELQGLGALQIAFEKLKQKLQAEGWFAPERKRALPGFPRRVGLVTSPTGAAIRDVLHVIQRRNAGLEIILAPCRVQGDGAAAEIAAAIRQLNELNFRGRRREEAFAKGVEIEQSPLTSAAARPFLDLILLTRGGGSLEDLWAFNEEIVARAIFESAVPVVSAVGHEIDFTISDFVADLRAATPSAAAEIITEGVFASRQFVAEASAWLTQNVRRRLVREREDWEQLSDRMARCHPERRLNELLQRLDDLDSGLLRGVRYRLREHRAEWQRLRQRLAGVRTVRLLARRRQTLEELARRLTERARAGWKASRGRLATVEARLGLLCPTKVLERGYSITLDASSGRIIRAAAEVRAGQRLKTRLAKGEVKSVAEDGL